MRGKLVGLLIAGGLVAGIVFAAVWAFYELAARLLEEEILSHELDKHLGARVRPSAYKRLGLQPPTD